MRRAPSAFFVMATLACGSIGGSAGSTAMAADLSARTLFQEGSLIPEEIGTGWYLRGDVGYGFNSVGSISHGNVDFDGVAAKDGFAGTLGFGYQFNDMLRADLTLDAFNDFDLSGSTSCAAWTVGCSGAATSERSTVSALAIMLNAYADLGTWYGITPYVGAGIGAAYLDVGPHDSTNSGATSAARVFGAYESWALAANVTTGASYTVAEGLMLDLSYRFVWIDSGRTDGATYSAETGHVDVKDLTSHQIRAGLRYYLF